ncbi:MAG: hypothetical protein M3R71_05290 [Actinomycetota bacterium]|nr:hypothetical protein [Actinomycetota bacterium]
MPAIDLTDINKTVKDSAYLAVGLGVLGFQKAQVRRREAIEALETQRKQFLDSFSGRGAQPKSVVDTFEAQRKQITEAFETQAKQVTAGVEVAREQLVGLVKAVDDRIAPARQQFEGRVDELEQRLPANAREAFHTVRSAAAAPEAAFRSAVGLS